MSDLMAGTVKFEIYVNKTHMHKVCLSVLKSQFICTLYKGNSVVVQNKVQLLKWHLEDKRSHTCLQRVEQVNQETGYIDSFLHYLLFGCI